MSKVEACTIAVIAVLVIASLLPGVLLVRDMRRESRGYGRMAREMRRQRDADPSGAKLTARLFKDAFK